MNCLDEFIANYISGRERYLFENMNIMISNASKKNQETSQAFFAAIIKICKIGKV